MNQETPEKEKYRHNRFLHCKIFQRRSFTYQVPKRQLRVHQLDKIQAVNKFQLENTLAQGLIYDSVSSIPASNAAETVCNISQEKRPLSTITEVR